VLATALDKTTLISTDNESLLMVTVSDAGESEDDLAFENRNDLRNIKIDPALILRGAKTCTAIGFTDKVTLMADAQRAFTHVIAHKV
jgi:hypothetical protein